MNLEVAAEWRRRYEAGESLIAIAPSLVDPKTVRRWILLAGGEIRPRGSAGKNGAKEKVTRASRSSLPPVSFGRAYSASGGKRNHQRTLR